MKKMTYKLVMAVTCFGMMAGDAIAQERGGREQGEGCLLYTSDAADE